MKKIFILALSLLVITQLYSQTQGITYQAVIVNKNPQEIPGQDISGNIIPNRAIMVRFTILDAAGTIDYQEEYSTTTDAYGMINLIIGQGTQTTSSPKAFNEIDWNGAPKDLKVDLSLSQADVFYTDFSNQQLNFVPYAYHKNITATGTLIVDGATSLNSRLDVKNSSPTFLTGSLTVDQSTLLQKDLTVDSISKLNGQVTIKADVNGDDDKYESYPLRIEGSNQGIAIKVDESRSNSNNYVTFWDTDGIQGRIEGQTTVDLLTDPEYLYDNSVFVVQLAVATAEEIGAASSVAAASASSTGCVGLGACVTAPIPSLIADAIKDLIIKSANLAVAIAAPIAYNVFKHTQIGVTYQSGAGDYAEWLPKSDINEKFSPGDIVGVKGGQISKSTEDADHYMVISLKPIVLGNMPKEGNESKSEKVAFMGQVPVKVFGKVQIGDYIIPSGSNNGVGIGVSPNNMQPDQYQKIVGIAWEANETSFGYINVAVGLNANDIARLSIKQEQKIEQQKDEINSLKDQLSKMNGVLSQLLPNYASMMNVDQTNSIKISNDKTLNQVSSGIDQNISKDVTNSDNTIYYYQVTTEQVEEGILLAEKSLKENGVDVSKHPFFSKMYSDPEYKKSFVNKIVTSINVQIDKNMKRDIQSGAKVVKF